MLVIPAIQDAAAEEQEFKVSLGYLLTKAWTQNISKQTDDEGCSSVEEQFS